MPFGNFFFFFFFFMLVFVSSEFVWLKVLIKRTRIFPFSVHVSSRCSVFMFLTLFFVFYHSVTELFTEDILKSSATRYRNTYILRYYSKCSYRCSEQTTTSAVLSRQGYMYIKMPSRTEQTRYVNILSIKPRLETNLEANVVFPS